MNILITREEDKAEKFAKLLKEAGHTPFILPMIECVPVEAEISGRYDYGVFTSLNAVKYFLPHRHNVTLEKIAAVGSATKKALEKEGFHVDLMPEEFSAGGLKKLFGGLDIRGKKFLMAGVETRAGDFHSWLKESGCAADIVTIYKTEKISRTKQEIESFISKNVIDIVTFASPSAVRAFFDQADTDRQLVAIGRTTADAAAAYGKKCFTPTEFTLDGMIKIINTLKR